MIVKNEENCCKINLAANIGGIFITEVIMPAVSEKQRRAMYAAAEGKSNLGIPENVGKEFVNADESEDESENELDIARKIKEGELSSPQKFANMWLFNIRVTGTGTAYRTKNNEFVYRPKKYYLNDEFLARCNGLSVLWQHPDKGVLNSQEFSDRIIGSCFLPYLKPETDEVWSIVKIYDDMAAQEMIDNQMSTSPTVVFQSTDGNETVTLKDGTELLVEGNPSLLDHLAICNAGVWDKGSDPIGVINESNQGEIKMVNDSENSENEVKEVIEIDDAKKTDVVEEDTKKVDDLHKKVDTLTTNFDALCKKMDELIGKPKEVIADKKVSDENEELKKRIDAVEEMLPKEISDEDFTAMADCQARADSVAMAFGESASRPQLGETVLGYRKRLANKFKQYSTTYKDLNIAKISDPALFSVVEKQIYSDAITTANNPVVGKNGGLREIKTHSPAGHQISTFKGQISTWMDDFRADTFNITHLNTGVK